MNVCRPCGLAGNALTCLVKYGELPKQPSFSASTYHTGRCVICCRDGIQVTEDRDFFFPDWKLIQMSAWRAAMRKAARETRQ